MRHYVRTMAMAGLLAVAWSATAAGPEMRCLINGAYIKVYGKNEAEERESCDRQGGAYTRYYAPQESGPAQRPQGINGFMGQRPIMR